MPPEDPVKKLRDWYGGQSPLTVDIVGDFAGRELFAIHGESLIRYCLTEAKVDFDEGFQLLHAVHAVEKLLSELKRRDCNFDVLFFRDHENLCVPQQAVGSTKGAKYRLTRRILIQHFIKSNLDFRILEFESLESNECQNYLSGHGVHFILCDDGRASTTDQATHLQYLIWKVMASGRHVAIINSITWRSSKVFMSLLSGKKDMRGSSLKLPMLEAKEPLSLSEAVLQQITHHPFGDADYPAREKHAMAFCRAYIEHYASANEITEAGLHRVGAFLLQVASLKYCSLQERACVEVWNEDEMIESQDHEFLHMFCAATQGLIEMPSELNEQEGWELFDIVDGRVFFYLLRAIRSEAGIPSKILEHARILYNETFRGWDQEVNQPLATLKSSTGSRPQPKAEKNLTALPFNHFALESYLRDVEIRESEEIQNSNAELVFEDLRHWHAYKLATQPKGRETLPVWFEKARQKKMQRRMAEVISYAASLTSSTGKTFNRETIVVGSQPRKSTDTGNKIAKPKHHKQKPGKGGKHNALLEAQKRNDEKAKVKLMDILNHWRDKYNEFEKVNSPIDRYLRALDFQSTGSSGSHDAVKPEVQLYLCHILMEIWIKVRKKTPEDSLEGLYLVSMIWSWLGKISKSAHCTSDTANAVQGIFKALAATPLPITTLDTPRTLPFYTRPAVLKKAPKLVKDTRLLQLEHGGPYMDRRFDSRPDARVQFEPDAWQRDVLDCIDANESVLVVAPTSAGKTFISFYAMKKVLEESDDGVLVYVAPTKALVNQIAAEIEARFSKSYQKQTGKSIWAVHTRDYRINNPSQCQILVTVPHMLQIMLLSPTNAVGKNAWSCRVKRIIFDEVHCIGQADDGVVWEQLLLLAPCPIIALSATVGNPNELRDWLSTAQAQKGYDMKMVVHGVRYSDLRKFTYDPPKDFAFEGLSNSSQLPVPGLDEGDSISHNFRFVHPVVALKDRNRSVLDDVNLEARDCLTLWNHMKKTFTTTLLQETAKLDPINVLPEWIEKQHVIEWEKNLKIVLRGVMKMENSPFPDLQESLANLKSPDQPVIALERHFQKLFPLVCDLHRLDSLPALVFNYDRSECEQCAQHILIKLQTAESNFRETDQAWRQKVQKFEQWKKQKDSDPDQSNNMERFFPNRSKHADDNITKLDLVREETSEEISRWEGFDPEAPLDQFSFADMTKMQRRDFDGLVDSLSRDKVESWLIDALRRGLGVHHAGMNRRYRQIVEMLFRRGYLRVVVATGTLALGINMPCKTVVFSGDSVFLSPQNYRQASGRAGRRGFDLLGNIIFNGISQERVHEIMSSRLPALRGQFPVSTTLILRLFILLDGTGNSLFALNAVNALLSQTRLYLGGPDAEMSVKHHLRFSIEYLRRQNLLSAKGAPVNFAGLVGHLYFTENAVFAFHSLIRGGYFHRLCEDIEDAQKRVLRELMLVLSHLFNRIPIKRTPKVAAVAAQSSSEIFLRRLPEPAEKLLISHNQDVLSIFKDYVNSYINQHLGDKPDRELPLTKVLVGPRKPCESSFMGGKPTVIRSPFAALSGFGDDFTTINDLCSGVRGGIFLEGSAIPYIPIWPHDTDTEFNAYIYDFFKHGSLKLLVRDNHIKQGDVWFHLKDFSLVLKTIVTSLKGVMNAEGDYDPDDPDDLDEDDAYMAESEVLTEEAETQEPEEVVKKIVKRPKRVKVQESWDDDSEEESDSENTGSTAGTSQSNANRKGGLILVLKAFKLLEEEFSKKFYKIGA